MPNANIYKKCKNTTCGLVGNGFGVFNLDALLGHICNLVVLVRFGLFLWNLEVFVRVVLGAFCSLEVIIRFRLSI